MSAALLERVVVMQYPIVLILIFLSFQARRIFQAPLFWFVGIGWVSNLVYLVIAAVRANGSPYAWLDPLANGLSATGSAFFLFAARRRHQGGQLADHFWSQSCLALGVGTLVGAIAEASRRWTVDGDVRIALVGAIPTVVIAVGGAASLLLAMRAFTAASSGGRRGGALVTGAALYLLDQPLYLLTLPVMPESVQAVSTTIGFTVGLVAKICLVVGHIHAFASVTAREQERATRLHEAEETVAKIAHELGTPIAEIMTYVETMQQSAPKTGLLRSTLVMLENAVHRIGAIVAASKDVPLLESAIALGKGTSGDVAGNEQQIVSVNALVETALMAVKRTRSEVVTFTISYSGNALVECIPFELIQVFVNLLRNAYDAFPGGEGRIWIRTTTTADAGGEELVEIEIRDDGEGLADSVREQLWRDGVSTRIGPGRGHGLSVVKRLVTGNGGSAFLENDREHGRGCRAIVRFPRAVQRRSRTERRVRG